MLERIPLLQGYPMTPINPGPNLLRKRTRKQVLLALFAAVVRSVGCGDGRNAVRSAAVPCIFGNRCFRRSTLCCAGRGCCCVRARSSIPRRPSHCKHGAGLASELLCERAGDKNYFIASVNRSPNRMANLLAACFQITGGIFQFFSMLRKARKRNFLAA